MPVGGRRLPTELHGANRANLGATMKASSISSDFQSKVSKKVRVEPEGIGRFRVFTPFRFDDGDHLAIVLKQEQDQWVLSDEANTFMRLTYDIEERDFLQGNRQQIISNALSLYGLDDREGELVLKIDQDRYGDALYSFVQALLRISDVTFLSRERVLSTFAEDFKSLIAQLVPEDRRTFDWHDPVRDTEEKYIVDCRINGLPKPLYVMALLNDEQTRDATITLHQFERWGTEFESLAIFDDQEAIGRKVLARFSDVCDKQYSNLGGNRDRIVRFVNERIAKPNAK